MKINEFLSLDTPVTATKTERAPRSKAQPKLTAEDKAAAVLEQDVTLPKFTDQVTEQKIANAEARGSHYLGSAVMFNSKTNGVRRDIFLDALDAADHIPKAWLPSPICPIGAYLDAVTAMGKRPISKYENGAELKEKGFVKYTVAKLNQKKNSDTPAMHRVFLTQTKPSDDPNVLQDIKIERSIVIALKNHDAAFARKYSNLEILPTYDEAVMTRPEFDELFGPFISHLSDDFKDKCQGYYDNDQIRAIVFQILRDKMALPALNRGIYFADTDMVSYVNELRETLKSVDKGLMLTTLDLNHIPDCEYSAEQVRDVTEAITDHYIKDLATLQADLVKLQESDTETRLTTWAAKKLQLDQTLARMQELEAKRLFVQDATNDLVDEINAILGQHLADVLPECPDEVAEIIAPF